MAPIPVPKPPKSAYNPRRPAGTLLQSQLLHLEWAVRPAGARTPKTFRIKPARTEREASTRIEQLTQELHRQATAGAAIVPPPTTQPGRAPSKQKSKRKPTHKPKPSRKPKQKPKSKATSRAPRPRRRRTSR